METTLDYAGTHLPELLERVAAGEEVLLRRGNVAVARIVPIVPEPQEERPQVGVVTSQPVAWTSESFAPLDDEGLQELGFP